ncbi:DNA-binding transcription factor yap1 [Modicella reniformis]|uniref:DNA-binding transcription factor yap1 n=1 Tax=Modicella reniformis TaxID=1440133 RepID=A0A9P6IN63_9FUNG|nr:DNA-binding transcription factor yap1 [Modicella reniformis]
MSLQQHTDIYSASLADSDWASILQNNHEAQELLSTAIAHHEQYREDDPVKRKGAISQAHSKASLEHHGDTAGDSQFENDSSDEVHAPGDGKPAPKKAGRKPLTTEPTNKRKAQNRAAQRAFRDRKEKYVKSLEDRIKELEDMNPAQSDSNNLAEENMNLRVLVQKLETENYFLKEQTFTFDFPISQPGLYNVTKANRNTLLTSSQKNTSSVSEQSIQSPSSQTIDTISSESSESPVVSSRPFKSTNVAKPVAYEHLPWSPPSSVADSVPNSPLDHDRSTPEREVTTQVTGSDSAGVVPRFRNSSPGDMALFASLLDSTTHTTSVNQTVDSPLQQSIQNKNAFALFGPISQLGQSNNFNINNTSSPTNTLAGLSEHTPSPTLDSLVNTPIFPSDGNLQYTPTTSSLSMPPLIFDPTQTLFTNFRDPSDPQDFLASLDDSIEPTPFPDDSIDDLFTNQLLDYTNTFVNITATPVRDAESQGFFGKAAQAENPKFTLPNVGENEKAIPCPLAWEKISKHPKFDDADIDDLCKEMKAKAKCSGHGPVIPVSHVDELMSRLDQE